MPTQRSARPEALAGRGGEEEPRCAVVGLVEHADEPEASPRLAGREARPRGRRGRPSPRARWDRRSACRAPTGRRHAEPGEGVGEVRSLEAPARRRRAARARAPSGSSPGRRRTLLVRVVASGWTWRRAKAAGTRLARRPASEAAHRIHDGPWRPRRTGLELEARARGSRCRSSRPSREPLRLLDEAALEPPARPTRDTVGPSPGPRRSAASASPGATRRCAEIERTGAAGGARRGRAAAAGGRALGSRMRAARRVAARWSLDPPGRRAARGVGAVVRLVGRGVREAPVASCAMQTASA